MARRLMREEGLMCGGSSGTAFWAAVKYIKEQKIGKGKRVVVLLPDNIRNYMTKHLNDDWMYECGYITEQECAKGAVSTLIPNTDWGQDRIVAELNLKDAIFLDSTSTIREAVTKFQSTGFDHFAVKEPSGRVRGALNKADVMQGLVKQRVTMDDQIITLVKWYSLRHVSSTTTLNELGRILHRNRFALVGGTKWVTASDLLEEFQPKQSSGGLGTMAVAAVVGFGVAAAGALLWMKQRNQ